MILPGARGDCLLSDCAETLTSDQGSESQVFDEGQPGSWGRQARASGYGTVFINNSLCALCIWFLFCSFPGCSTLSRDTHLEETPSLSWKLAVSHETQMQRQWSCLCLPFFLSALALSNCRCHARMSSDYLGRTGDESAGNEYLLDCFSWQKKEPSVYLSVNLEPHGPGQVVLCRALRRHLRHSKKRASPR